MSVEETFEKFNTEIYGAPYRNAVIGAIHAAYPDEVDKLPELFKITTEEIQEIVEKHRIYLETRSLKTKTLMAQKPRGVKRSEDGVAKVRKIAKPSFGSTGRTFGTPKLS